MAGRFTVRRAAAPELVPVEEPSPALEGVSWTVFPDAAPEPARTDLRDQLAGLVYPGFVTATGWSQLPQLPRYLRAAQRRLDRLAENPARCPLAPENEYFDEEIRELFYGKRGGVYRILFTIVEETVSVLYVRHGARDYVRPGAGEDEASDSP